jgi:hypothetical protein
MIAAACDWTWRGFFYREGGGVVAIGLSVDPCDGCGLYFEPLDIKFLGVIGGNGERWIVVFKGVQKL